MTDVSKESGTGVEKLISAKEYVARGDAYYDNGDLDLAIADYTEAIRLDPNDVGAYFNRGLAYADSGDFDPAIADITEVIRLNPDNETAKEVLSKLNADKLSSAEECANVIVVITPSRVKSYLDYIRICVGGDDPIITDFDETMRNDSGSVAAYYNSGRTHGTEGDLDLAIADFTEVIEVEPDNEHAKEALSRLNAGK